MLQPALWRLVHLTTQQVAIILSHRIQNAIKNTYKALDAITCHTKSGGGDDFLPTSAIFSLLSKLHVPVLDGVYRARLYVGYPRRELARGVLTSGNLSALRTVCSQSRCYHELYIKYSTLYCSNVLCVRIFAGAE